MNSSHSELKLRKQSARREVPAVSRFSNNWSHDWPCLTDVSGVCRRAMRSANYKKGPTRNCCNLQLPQAFAGDKQLLPPMAHVPLLQRFLLQIFWWAITCVVQFFNLFVCVKRAIAVQKVLLVMPMEITLKSPKESIKQVQCYQVMFKPIHKLPLIVEEWKVCCEKSFYTVENINTTCWGWNSPTNIDFPLSWCTNGRQSLCKLWIF